MKNIISFSLFILLICGLSFSQGAPTANAYGADYTFDFDRNFGVANGLVDTLQAVDSITLLNQVALADNYNYILRVGPTTGSGNDSVEALVKVYYLGGAGDTNVIYTEVIDTIKTATGEAILLSMNRGGWAKKYTMKLIGGAANGGVVIMNKLSLVRRQSRLR